MDRRTSIPPGPVDVLIICVIIITILALIVGITPVSGFLWNVDQVDDISLGPSENQTVSGIKVYSEDDPVKIRVGSLVDAGAEFDEDSSSYDLKNGQTANESEVYIRNPNTTNATIIVRSSALDNTSSFDVTIRNINTTGIRKYNNKLEEISYDHEYVTTQAGESDKTKFSIEASTNISFKSDPYDNETNTIKFEDIKLVNNTTNQIVVWKRSSGGELTERIATTQGSQESITINNDSIKGKENIAVTIQPEWANSTEIIYAADLASVTAPISAKLLQEPIYYPKNENLDQTYSESVYFEFNTDIRENQGHININYLNGTTSRITIENQSDNVAVFDDEVYLFLNSTENGGSQDYIQNISIDGVKSAYGGEEISQDTYNSSRVSSHISNTTDKTIAKGERIVILSNESEDIRLFSENKSLDLSGSGDYNHNKVVDTSELPAGEYTLESESRTNGSQINIIEASLSPNIPTTVESRGIKIGFESSPLNRHITLSVLNSSSTTVTTRVANIERKQKENISIGIVEPGEYDLEIQDVHSGETTRRSVRILEDRNLTLSFDTDPDKSGIGTRYDVEVHSSYNNSKLDLLENSSNTTLATANLTTPAPGRTTIGLNTYALGNESLTDRVFTAGSNATVESVNASMSNGTLPAGTYRVAVRSEQGLATTADEATVTIGNRSTNGLTAYATTDLSRDDLGTADAVRRAIGNGTLSPTSSVAPDETVVYAANATGLTGLPTARNATMQTGTDLARLDGLAFDVRSNASTTTGADESVPANSSVHLDESGLFLVSDGDDALATDETPTDGEAFTAEFRVEDDRLREAASNSTTDHDASVTVTFKAPESDGEVSGVDDSLSDAEGSGTGGETDERGAGTGRASGSGTGGGGGGSGTGGTDSSDGGQTPDDGRPETTPAGDAPSTGSAGDRSDDGARAGLGVIGGRVEVRPAPDVRGVANSDSDVSSAAVSVPAVPTRVGHDPSRSEAGTPDGDPTGSGAGSEGTAAGEDEASSSDGAAGASGTTDESATESDPTGAEPPAPNYDDAPIRATAEDVPGFGPVAAVIALLVAGRLGARRR